jgi:hypothetical protein
VLLAGQHRQPLQGDRDVVFIHYAIDLCQIARCLGFVNVSDGNQANFKALLGLLQLAFEGALLCLRCRQVVLGTQHQQVGFCHPHDQVLLIGSKGGFRLAGELFAGLEAEPGRQVEQGLAQGDLIALAGGVYVGLGLYGSDPTLETTVY